jgi:hypothetical protein
MRHHHLRRGSRSPAPQLEREPPVRDEKSSCARMLCQGEPARAEVGDDNDVSCTSCPGKRILAQDLVELQRRLLNLCDHSLRHYRKARCQAEDTGCDAEGRNPFSGSRDRARRSRSFTSQNRR